MGKKNPLHGQEEAHYVEWGNSYTSGHYTFLINEEKTQIFKIRDQRTREVVLCMNVEDLKRHIAKRWAQEYQTFPSPRQVERIIESWQLHGDGLQEMPATIGWPDDPGYVFKRLDFVISEGPTLAWDEFTPRTSDPEAFKAYIWSIFEPKNSSRQFLYLFDPKGESGKSVVFDVLSKCLGNACAAINNNQIKNESRFLLSAFRGKRLVIYPDCKNPSFCMSELVRNFTSGDQCPIEYKGKDTFRERLYLKLIIGSNVKPVITNTNPDLSRLLRIDVRQGMVTDDPEWAGRLESELPHFLYNCKEAYQRLSPNHGKIRLSEATQELVSESAGQIEERWEAIFEENLETDPSSSLTASEMKEVYSKEKLTAYEQAEFVAWLKRKYSVDRKRIGASKATTYLGIKKRGCGVRKPPLGGPY